MRLWITLFLTLTPVLRMQSSSISWCLSLSAMLFSAFERAWIEDSVNTLRICLR